MNKFNIKIGDKLMCRLNYVENEKIIFFAGKMYEVVNLHFHGSEYMIQSENIDRVVGYDDHFLSWRFYAKEHVRRMKMKSIINEC